MGRDPPSRLLLSCSERNSNPALSAILANCLERVSRKAYVFWAKTPGLVSPCGEPKRNRSPIGSPSISTRGIPKLTLELLLTWSKANRVKLKRASFSMVDEIGLTHDRKSDGLSGWKFRSAMGRPCAEESALTEFWREMKALMANWSLPRL